MQSAFCSAAVSVAAVIDASSSFAPRSLMILSRRLILLATPRRLSAKAVAVHLPEMAYRFRRPGAEVTVVSPLGLPRPLVATPPAATLPREPLTVESVESVSSEPEAFGPAGAKERPSEEHFRKYLANFLTEKRIDKFIKAYGFPLGLDWLNDRNRKLKADQCEADQNLWSNLCAAWEERSPQMHEVGIFVAGLGISIKRLKPEELYKKFGDGYKDIIMENPYSLMDLKGVGWATADDIALKFKLKGDKWNPRRLEVALKTVIEQKSQKWGSSEERDSFVVFKEKLGFDDLHLSTEENSRIRSEFDRLMKARDDLKKPKPQESQSSQTGGIPSLKPPQRSSLAAASGKTKNTKYAMITYPPEADFRKYLGFYLPPTRVEKFIQTFGFHAGLDWLNNSTKSLSDDSWLALCSKWNERLPLFHEIGIFIAGLDLSINKLKPEEVYKSFGEGYKNIIFEDPYRLMELKGVGWATADDIALKFKLNGAKLHPERTKYALKVALDQESNKWGESNRSFIPSRDLLTAFRVKLDLEALTPETEAQVKAEFEQASEICQKLGLVKTQTVFQEGKSSPTVVFYPNDSLDIENEVVKNIQARIIEKRKLTKEEEDLINKEFPTTGVEHQEKIREIMKMVLTSPLSLITGGPGTGKTTSIKEIVRCLTILGKTVGAACMTAKAATRLEEVVGISCNTLHTSFKIVPGAQSSKRYRIRKGAEHETPDFFIIDEISMVDLTLAHVPLNGLPKSTSIIMIGDQNQLPPIQPGSLLRELLAVPEIPKIELTRNFRQTGDNTSPSFISNIILNANEIKRGLPPSHFSDFSSDCVKIELSKSKQDADEVEDVVMKALEIARARGFHDLSDIQFLSPFIERPFGTLNLNRILQKIRSGKNDELDSKAEPQMTLKDYALKKGDRVLQIENDNPRKVFNGTFGVVHSVSSDGSKITVLFEGRPHDKSNVPLSYSVAAAAKYLDLSYAITIHKSQGSEYPCVVLFIADEHLNFVFRELLYTAVTRARQLLILVSSNTVLIRAAENSGNKIAGSFLAQKIRKALDGDKEFESSHSIHPTASEVILPRAKRGKAAESAAVDPKSRGLLNEEFLMELIRKGERKSATTTDNESADSTTAIPA